MISQENALILLITCSIISGILGIYTLVYAYRWYIKSTTLKATRAVKRIQIVTITTLIMYQISELIKCIVFSMNYNNLNTLFGW